MRGYEIKDAINKQTLIEIKSTSSGSYSGERGTKKEIPSLDELFTYIEKHPNEITRYTSMKAPQYLDLVFEIKK
jgi:hypothetical protein